MEIKSKQAHLRTKSALTADMLLTTVLCLCLTFAILLSTASLFHSYVLDPAHYESQHLYEIDENELTNVCACLFGCAALILFYRKVRVSRRLLLFFAAVLLPLYAAVGILWVTGTKAIPSSDPGFLIKSARLIVDRQFTAFHSLDSDLHFYFLRFPFQFGFLSYIELLMRIFGSDKLLVAAPVLNVLFLTIGYVAILKSTQKLFSSHAITLVTLLFLVSCMQPLIGCSLMYGTIPAFALSMWGCYFLIRFFESDRTRNIALCAAFLAGAVYLKSNSLIIVVAAALLLFVRAIRRKKPTLLLCAALIVLAAVPLPRLVQHTYEQRIGMSFGRGLPKSAWMAMSTESSSMAPGWYSTYSWKVCEAADGDMELVAKISRADFIDNLRGFCAEPAVGVKFFRAKLFSQWNENTFQSIWTSRVCDTTGQPAAYVKSVYDGALKEPVEFYMNQYVQFLYFCYALGLLALLFRKRSEALLLYPLILLGAVLFHLLFEARAQYVLTLLPQFAPVAAAAFAHSALGRPPAEGAK